MRHARMPARINIKALVTLVLVVVVLGALAVTAREVRRRVIANKGLTAGLAAFEREDWAEACIQLKRYLERFPEEKPDVLEKYQRWFRLSSTLPSRCRHQR